MTERAKILRAYLKELNQAETISSLDDRKRLQKLVYLAQHAGAPLGYGFSWYLKGPYSSSLSKDYYNMPPNTAEAVNISAAVRDALGIVNGIAEQKPEGLDLADWLEIVSSVHYLDRVSRLSADGTIDKLRREKPKLVQYAELARDVIAAQFPTPAAQAN